MSEEQNIPGEKSTDHSPQSTDERLQQKEENLQPVTEPEFSPNDSVEQIQISKPQTSENMEVHHPHHVTHKKKWKEYLLEFFMLFLAVFLGFIAENIREGYVERHREKVFIESIIQDLKTDTAKLSTNISAYYKMSLMQDTLLKIFPLYEKGFNPTLERLHMGIEGYPDFIYTDGTIQQLRSGGFRLIRNKHAVDSIMDYDAFVKITLIVENEVSLQQRKVYDIESELFNNLQLDQAYMYHSPDEIKASEEKFLLKDDTDLLAKYYNVCKRYQSLCSFTKYFSQNLKIKAERLIRFLQKEYHLE